MVIDGRKSVGESKRRSQDESNSHEQGAGEKEEEGTSWGSQFDVVKFFLES